MKINIYFQNLMFLIIFQYIFPIFLLNIEMRNCFICNLRAFFLQLKRKIQKLWLPMAFSIITLARVNNTYTYDRKKNIFEADRLDDRQCSGIALRVHR